MSKLLRKALRAVGYDLVRVPPRRPSVTTPAWSLDPVPVSSVWPLPRVPGGPSDAEIRAAFDRFELWHYAYELEGGLSFPARHREPGLATDDPRRPHQRFAHFMPYLMAAQGGSLRGKRVLDIACNSGFWSLQCALLGAEVVGFDARPELIEQANLLKSLTGLENVEFRTLDFWEMTPEALGRTFDVVLFVGVLYHLPKPLEALERALAMCDGHLVLDTAVYTADAPLIQLRWEEPYDIRAAHRAGVVAFPTKRSVELMLRHLRVGRAMEVPIRGRELPPAYLSGGRASWLIDCGSAS